APPIAPMVQSMPPTRVALAPTPSIAQPVIYIGRLLRRSDCSTPDAASTPDASLLVTRGGGGAIAATRVPPVGAAASNADSITLTGSIAQPLPALSSASTATRQSLISAAPS